MSTEFLIWTSIISTAAWIVWRIHVWEHRRRECELGRHQMRQVERKIYRWPSRGFDGVADSVKQKRERCAHCAHATPWLDVHITILQGLKMDSSRWDALREKGEIEQW